MSMFVSTSNEYGNHYRLDARNLHVINHLMLTSNATDDHNPNPFIIDTGNTAWILTSTALVLFMTIPALALFYAGMVSAKNVLAVCMQQVSITCLITIVWMAFGYSLAFCPSFYYGVNTVSDQQKYSIYGDSSRFWLRGMQVNSFNSLYPSVPEAAYAVYQLTFAIITPALICGSIADRMKYWSMLLFMAMWSLAVYCPIAHSVWHPDGFLYRLGVLDTAGGNAVETASGVSGLVAALVIGNRKGWVPKNFDTHPPHNILLTFMGMCMLWVGWLGFNAGGSTNMANAAYCVFATQIASSSGALTWMLLDSFFRGKPSVLGIVNGAIAALVCITPAAGYVDMNGAFFVGLFGSFCCYFGSQLKHYVFKVDDALDAFGIHGIGGIVGLVCTGFFATSEVTGVPDQSGVYYANTWVGGHLLGKQVISICFTVTWSAVVTYILMKAIDLTIGLRVSAEEEEMGLDSSLHGESLHADQTGYTTTETGEIQMNSKYAEKADGNVAESEQKMGEGQASGVFLVDLEKGSP